MCVSPLHPAQCGHYLWPPFFAGIAVFISTPPPPDFFVVAPELKGTALQQREEERLVITQARERASQAS